MPDEQRLLMKMFRVYDNSVRPVYNATNNVVVKFGLTLIQIMDMVSTKVTFFIKPLLPGETLITYAQIYLCASQSI